MYRPLFTFPVLFATSLLLLHSWLFRGPKNTLIFFGLGYVAAFLRELGYQNVSPSYVFRGADLGVFNVPITIPLGWLFEAYISLYVAQVLLGVDNATILAEKTRIAADEYRRRVLPVILVACAVNSSIVYAIENTAVRMRWWYNQDGSATMDPNWILGHTYTVFWLLTLLIYVSHAPLRQRINVAYLVAAVLFVAVIKLNLFESGRSRATWALAWLVIGAYAVVLVNLCRRLLPIFLGGLGLGVLVAFALFPLASRYRLADLVDFGTVGMLFAGLVVWRTQRPARAIAPAHLL
jgi:hypothetical protein